ncbi:alpha/beta hydrolase fold protein [Hyaloraphidium curvatum]|nr:alpha/beta hydrolase fold protein [Hyaloraphidium curvatum]
MPRARNGDVELEYEVFGTAGDAVILVNGLGSQLLRWPAELCAQLAAQGFRVVRMDNRDVGLSTWLPGREYTIADMAGDVAAVADALGAERFHVVGMSLGGMVAQRTAINYPRRVLSLVSIMSGANVAEFRSTEEARRVLAFDLPDPKVDEDAYIAQMAANRGVIASPGFRMSDEELRAATLAEYRRAYNPDGIARQRAAVMTDPDRTPLLRELDVPTVILHGKDDPLVMPSAAEAMAAAMSHAELRIIDGMGHDVPPGLYGVYVDAILAATSKAKERAH